MAPWGEDASGSKSAWQHYQCSVEEWNAVLEFDRVLRTFEVGFSLIEDRCTVSRPLEDPSLVASTCFCLWGNMASLPLSEERNVFPSLGMRSPCHVLCGSVPGYVSLVPFSREAAGQLFGAPG